MARAAPCVDIDDLAILSYLALDQDFGPRLRTGCARFGDGVHEQADMVNAVGNGIFAVVDRRRVVLRADQLDLDIAPIADRKREQGVGWLAAIFHVAQPDILHDEEGPKSDRFGPVANDRKSTRLNSSH